MLKSYWQGRNLTMSVYRSDTKLASPIVSNLNWALTRDGYALPGWRDIIRNGGDATTNYTVKTRHVHNVDGNLGMSFKNPGVAEVFCTITGDVIHWTDFPDASVVDSTATDILAYRSLLKKLREDRVSFSGQVFLGELRESFHMLKAPAKALREGLSAYVRKAKLNSHAARRNRPNRHSDVSRYDNRFNDVSRPQAVLAKTYLEAVFGWVPLVNDIQSALVAIRKISERSNRRGISGSGVTETSTHIGHGSLTLSPGFFKVWYSRDRVDHCTVKYKMGLKADWDVPEVGINRAIELCGFNWQEFIPTAWELLPWSFLADYFTNIGDILEYGATNTQGKIYCVKNVMKKSELRTTMYNDPTYAKTLLGSVYRSSYGQAGFSNNLSEQYQRSRVDQLYCPEFRLEIPGVSAKWINMGALLLQGKVATLL